MKYMKWLSVVRVLAVFTGGITVGALAAVAVPAIGVTKQDSAPQAAGLADSLSSPGDVDVSQIERIAATRTANGVRVSLSTAPTSGGGRCELVDVDSPDRPQQPGNLSRTCSIGPQREQTLPISVTVSWVRSAGHFDPVLSGAVASGSGIVSLQLQTAAGTSNVPILHGLFLAALPESPKIGLLSANQAPYLLTGYSGSGAVVNTVDLEHVLSKAQPS